ncbi:MAG: PilZ domain-containing protein [Spirochaetes bacterium]|nr:PilZ domain-containing protein [Spirochaetota bacterium]
MEKRRFPRAKSSFPVWCQIYFGKEISFDKPKTKDLSASGMLLLMPEESRIGANMILKFKIPQLEEKILVQGRVVRVNKSGSKLFDTGVKFLIIRDKDIKAINQFVITKK